MDKPVLHLICNAHLDPVWQWRWDEGAAEALTTFGIAARLLREFPSFVFNHNEALLYRWVLEYDPPLFHEIRRLVDEHRWCVAGGWDLQPDVNLPGTEAIIRHITEGRRFFQQHFGVRPVVAYNLDSFGHSGGLPQILKQAGYLMYIHMRPGQKDLPLPDDVYRWRGADGSEIAVHRIAFTAYNTFHGKAVERIQEAVELALRQKRDVPVFWGLGDHGGGATREELLQIHELMKRETRVSILHSSTERYFRAIQPLLPGLPLVTGDLQRVFTGCYSSMSRLKRRMQRNLGELVQTEAARTITWWLHGQSYPADELRDAWRDHLFNDFHDILPGSCIEQGELDALDLYGRSSETHRRLRLGAVSGFSRGEHLPLAIPLTLVNINPGAVHVPIEVEYMIDHVPRWEGTWHARLLTANGQEVSSQEEAPDSLLLVNEWRRKISFAAELPHAGAAQYHIVMEPGAPDTTTTKPMVRHATDPRSGLLTGLDAGAGREILAGPAPEAFVMEDLADSWGMEEWSYRTALGKFTPAADGPRIIEEGAVRRIMSSAFAYGKSSLQMTAISYADFPFLEFRYRITWNEERKRLKLCIPTVIRSSAVLCEVPGGVISRPADGQEHVQGRWLILSGLIAGQETALAVLNSGQNGFDVKDGEIRLTILRSPLYCHERTFPEANIRQRKHHDQGVHEVRLLLLAGDTEKVRHAVTGLADWLNAPPYALAHYPRGADTRPAESLLTIEQGSVRLTACKQSWDGGALILRFQEAVGSSSRAIIRIHEPAGVIELPFRPLEIKTVRYERNGDWREVSLIDEV